MKIQYLYLEAQFKENREVRRGIDGILSSGQSVMGAAVKEFDRNLIFEMQPLPMPYYTFRRLKVLF